MTESVANLRALRRVAEILNRALDLKEALDESLVIICEILGLRSGWVFLTDDDGLTYRLAAAHGLPPGLLPDQPVWLGGCQCNALARSGKLESAVNMVRCSRIEEAEESTEGLTHHASIPLVTPRGQIGILNVACESGENFPQEKLDLLDTVGNQMGVAVERAAQFEREREQRRREQDALLRLSEIMLTESDLNTIHKAVVRIAAEALGADCCLLGLAPCADTPVLAELGTATYGTEQNLVQAGLCLDAPAPAAFLALAKPGQVLLDESQVRVQIFSGEGEVEEEDLASITEDEETWSFWRRLGCKGVFLAPVREIARDRTLGLLAVGYRRLCRPAADAHLTALLANQAALAIEQALLWEVRRHQESMARELAVARDIQSSFLPGQLPSIPGWDMSATYEPAREVGGDFYDVIELGPHHLGLAVADVAGKGVPAALVMALSRTLLRAMALNHSAPEAAVKALNRLLLEQSRKDRFLSLFYAVLDTRSGRLRYVRAGHNPPMHIRAQSNGLALLEGLGLVLGVTNQLVLQERETHLAQGDVLLLFTDGVTEAMTPHQEPFGEERLQRLCLDHCRDSAAALVSRIHLAVRKFELGAPAADDFTLLAVKRSQAPHLEEP